MEEEGEEKFNSDLPRSRWRPNEEQIAAMDAFVTSMMLDSDDDDYDYDEDGKDDRPEGANDKTAK